jgi:hypothetical protein
MMGEGAGWRVPGMGGSCTCNLAKAQGSAEVASVLLSHSGKAGP